MKRLTTTITNEAEGRRSTEVSFPTRATVLFAALTVAGTVLVATADRLVAGFDQTVMGEMGSAIFGGGLAFFLVEMFRWARERNASK
jgi:hypothetical protein